MPGVDRPRRRFYNPATVYQDPSPDGYRTARTVRRGDRLAPLAFPDWELAASDVLN